MNEKPFKNYILQSVLLWVSYCLLMALSIMIWTMMGSGKQASFSLISGAAYKDLFIIFSDFLLRFLPAVLLISVINYRIPYANQKILKWIRALIMVLLFVLLVGLVYYISGKWFYTYHRLPLDFWFNAVIAAIFMLFIPQIRVYFLCPDTKG